MAKKLNESLNPVLAQARKKSQLTWLHIYAPWCESSRVWKQELSENPAWLGLREQMQSLEWNRDWSPEIDQGLQTFLQARTGQQGWPVNVFLTPEGRAVFLCGALEIKEFVELTRQLWVAWQTDPVALRQQAEKELHAFRKTDPLAVRADKTYDDSQDNADILSRAGLYRFLTPLEKSLQMDTGLVGVGNVFQYPVAYRALLGFEDLGRWGELSLVRLARSPLNDVIGGGFFRMAVTDERVQDAEARASWAHVSKVSTEKLLTENAELLETLIEAHQTRKAAYISQAAFELLDAILEDFRIQTPVGNETTTSFASALSASKKFYELAPEDLLKALPPRERQAAQIFFGIEGNGARIPRIPTEVQLLSEFVNVEPVDLRLQLIDSRRRLKDYRKARSGAPSKCPPERLSELTLLRVLAYAAFAFDTPQVSETCVEMLDRYREEWNADSSAWTTREKGAYLRALCSMARLHSAHRDQDEAKKCFEEAETLIFGLQDPVFREAIVEVPFLGARLDVCDHTGISGLASLLSGLLDYNALSRMGLRGKHNLPVDIGHSLSEGLMYARTLGIYGAGLYWVLMRYQKLQQPEAHA
ncbi:MAG: DUF255 domain-containing protein [Bdellovibrionota bacterium]